MHYFDNAETDSYTGICDTFYYLFIIVFFHCSLQKLKLGAARIFFSSFKHTDGKHLLGEAFSAYDVMFEEQGMPS